MPTTNTSAVAPWLGYKSQEYRLVQRLLEADNTSILGFEILDDVEEHSGDFLTLEQDKISTTDRNIVSNHSKDLWKTLSNWIDLIKENKIDPNFTSFVLYTNKFHSSEVLEILKNAITLEDAEIAFHKIYLLVENPSDNIKKYIVNFFDQSDSARVIIKNFDYLNGSGSVSEDLKETYLNKRLGSIVDHIEDILFEILGWVGDYLIRAAEKRVSTIISAKSFGQRIGEIESKYRQRTILNYICSRDMNSFDVINDFSSEPNYIKQLRLIDIDDEDVEEAVLANLEAKDAIVKWTLDGYIQESSYDAYQKIIKRKWKTQKINLQSTDDGKSNSALGARIYYNSIDATESVALDNKKVGGFFSHGTLHSLANELTIGWHPEYKDKMRNTDDNT